MPIEPGIEKTLYKMIKKHTGKKVDLLAAFKSIMVSEIGVLPGLPIPMMCCIDVDSLWMVNEETAFGIPLIHLKPQFERYSKNGAVPTEFGFELLTTGKLINFKPADASMEPHNFWLWTDMLAERNGYSWWR
jgi:hypothetical protein